MAQLTYRDAVAAGIAQEMRRDPNVVLLGEDVAAAGGVFKATVGLLDEFGAKRVKDTPISEQAIVGAAMGAAMTGLRPIVDLMFSDFFAVTWDIVANQIAKTRYMTDGQVTLPLVIRSANGAGSRFGAQHSQSVENWSMMIPGLKIVAPATDFTTANAAVAMSLPIALGLALVGGLLLNLMPCVFPVLSLKALTLASHVREERSASRREGVAFGAGVILSFAALGAAILALRAAGEQLGWGFQLQSPAVVATLAVLFFVMALNLSGVFEFGALLPSRIATWSLANRSANAFASGVLAVAIASPCTAPFMGAAVGYALGERAHVTLGIFVALGIGMALPYVALAWFPAWRRALPKPGPWMMRLKQLLAFPLYATVAWLVWVLGAQVGNDAVLRIGAVLVAVAFALWAWRAWRGGGRTAWATVAIAGALAGLGIAWPLMQSGERAATAADTARPGAASIADDGWEPYSTARVAELTAQGRSVFVDFTAAWCITCQVNKRLVLNDPRVRDAFAKGGVALVRADWTRRDPAITQALAALGRSGVPVYVLYRKDGEARLLPEVLQRQAVIDAVAASS